MIFFDTIVKRVANFSTQSYEQNKNNLLDFFEKNELFNLCILTASGSLYSDVNKNKSEKTQGSLANYFMRAHFNPTPFGVFNSVGVMHWDTETNISKADDLTLMVKYDNLFVCTEINKNVTDKWIDLIYCSNPSIYFSNDKICFYKSKNQPNNKIEISYSEIDVDEDLLWLLDQFKNGKKIALVAEELVDQGFEREEVDTFLLEIIDIGLIIDSFLFNSYAEKLYVSQKEYVSDLICQKPHKLKTKNDFANFTQRYIKEQSSLFRDETIPKNFYAINAFDSQTGTLNNNIKQKVKKYIDFVIHYNAQTIATNDNLDKFFGLVKNKYNDGFVPLNTIFNPYSGIKYNYVKAENELKLHKDILSKILGANGSPVFLDLPVEDNLGIKSSKLPATFNVVLETLTCRTSGRSIIYIHGMGDPSSLNIISRFSDITHDACQDIINYEKEVNKDKIIAEINCIGNFRSINIAPVKQKYDYCLPINTSYDDFCNPVFLSDIYVHLRNNKVVLVSKEHKKQILLKKISAINQRILDSDIYNFLCDFEMYNQEIHGVNFNFNAYKQRLFYIPRIYLEEDILLYPAQMLLVYNGEDLKAFNDYFQAKIEEFSFSKKIVYLERQRKYVLDSDNNDHVKLLLEKIKSNRNLYVSEFLYESFNPDIQRNNENFAHELVIGVKNPYYSRESFDYSAMDISFVESHNTAVVSDWLYLELYCNIYADSEIFSMVHNKIILENKADQFFFVNYGIPDRHLRLRFKTASIENKQYIINLVHELKAKNIISKYHILPYEQEIHRYGGIEMMELSEFIFDIDSRDFLANIANDDKEKKTLEIMAVLKIKSYLNLLGFSLDDMILNCENVIKNYSQEFELTSELRKEFNKEYANIKFEIANIEYDDFLANKELRFNFAKKWKSVSTMHLVNYAWLMIHMSMNRHFKEEQRFNEFKMYYFAKCYFNQLKFKKN